MSNDYPPYQSGNIQPLQPPPLPPLAGVRWEPPRALEPRTHAQICAAWSMVAAAFVIVGCVICVGTHFLNDVNVPLWWIPILFLVAVAGGLTIAAYQIAPAEGQPQRQFVLGMAGNSLVLLAVAASAFAITTFPMSFLLFLKSEAGAAEMKRVRQRAEMAQRQRIREQRQVNVAQSAYQREMLTIEANIRDAERRLAEADASEQLEIENEKAAEVQLVAERDRLSRTAYATALLACLTKPDSHPVPPYAGLLDWKQVNVSDRGAGERLLPQVHRDATTVLLSEKTTPVNGLTINQLKLIGGDFLPEIAVRKRPQGTLLLFARRSGEILEVTPNNWQQQATIVVGGRCQDVFFKRDNIYVARDNPGSILTMEYRREDPRTGVLIDYSQTLVNAPRQLTVNNRTLFGVTSETAPQLWAKIDRGVVTEVQELAKVRDPNSRFLPEQLGRDVFVDGGRQIFVAQKDGVYRGQLPASNATSPASRNDSGGFATLSGKHFSAGDEDFPLDQITWTKVLPAAGIDVTKFATMGNELLATCNEQTNLILFDKQGKPHSQHTWPGAGRTVGIAGARDLPLLIVFTQNSVFAVSNEVVSTDPPFVVNVGKPNPPPPENKQAVPPPEVPALKPGERTYPVVSSHALPRANNKNIAGESTKLRGANVTELKVNAQRWVWGEDENQIFALEGNTIHRINVQSKSIEISVDLAPEEGSVSHFAATITKLVAIVPKARQLAVLNPVTLHPVTFELAGFTIKEGAARPGFFAATRDTDNIAISYGPDFAKKTDIFNVWERRVVTTIEPRFFTPPCASLQTMALGENLVIAVEGGRLYTVEWNANTWRVISNPRATNNYKTDSFAYNRRTGRLYMGTKTSINFLTLKGPDDPYPPIEKPADAQIAFTPDGEYYWLDNGKQFDLNGRATVALDLPKTGGGVTIGPLGNKLMIGNQLIELTK
ncbi:hypothetical protein [Anatilimnocola floriformis]|uniref:hypothetical protein n=1 Tax=Anatilimnocola floriformis TaxID=2948575 RepID=UPI0020C503B6|nr:hypothetical protein [Anatilimnocola floriformis]